MKGDGYPGDEGNVALCATAFGMLIAFALASWSINYCLSWL